MPTLRLDDIQLHYQVHGKDAADTGHPALLLLPDLGADGRCWAPVVRTLAERRRVVCIDLRGAGRTLPPDAPNSIGHMAEDALALAAHLELAHFDLLGHGLGGFVALECALRRPKRIARLILANTGVRLSARNARLFSDWSTAQAGAAEAVDARWWRDLLYWRFTPGWFEDDDTVDRRVHQAVTDIQPATAAGFQGQVAAMHGFDRRAALGRVRSTTLVLAGERDMLFPPGGDGAGLAGIARARVVVIPGQGHAIHAEAPELFLEPVLDYLR
jgi:pimeloyl-ACP methyl ester carboxylesterase